MKWKEEYNIGVEIVDKAHQQLFAIVYKMMDLLEKEDVRKQQFACKEGIKFFKSYAVKHFAQEEAYMRSIRYPGYEKHHAIHESLKNQTLPVLEDELEDANYSEEAIRHFLGICIGWLTTHIMIEDQAIAGKTLSKFSDLRTEDEITKMASAISQIVEMTFGIQPVLMSEHYAGWDIGEALHYEFVYNDKNQGQVRIIMVLEERLILSTTGQMLGMEFESIDTIVLSAVKEIVQMFMLRIADMMQFQDDYKAEDHLITTARFRELYLDSQPQYSLLFNTNKGYFVICIDQIS